MVSARLYICGPFRIELPDNRRLNVRSRKGQALLAMLATSPSGERTRAWLQDHLWGSRGREQAQGSLRNEILELNRLLEGAGLPPLTVTRQSVAIDRTHIELTDGPGVFLEGFDIPGEESFEDWLRDMRASPPEGKPAAPPVAKAAEFSGPSLVVLPFGNGTGDSGLDYLAEGTADELMHRLCRVRWLMVIAPGVPPAEPEATIDAGRRLGARYVLTGRMVRRSGNFRLSAALADTTSGQLVWAQPFDMPAPQADSALDAIVDRMVALLDDRIDSAEQVRATAARHLPLAVHDLIWRGRWYQNRLTRADLVKAGEYFDAAAELAPDSGLAIVEQAQHRAYRIWSERQPPETFVEIRRLAEKAIRLDADDARAHMMLGVAETWLRRPDVAETILTRAVGLNPNLPIAHEQLATLYNLSGRAPEAIAPLLRSLKLSPADFRLFYKLTELALAHLLTGDYPDAAARAMEAITLRRGYWHAHVVRVNALVRMGLMAEARAALADLAQARPNFTPDQIGWIPFVDPADNAMLVEGLRRAGG